MSTGDIKYLIPADGDELWGLTVTGFEYSNPYSH